MRSHCGKLLLTLPGEGPPQGGEASRHAVWRQAVESIKLVELTPAKIQHWKLCFVANAGDDPVKQRSARILANSFLRRAKSLFAPRMMKQLEKVSLPNPLPLDGVEFYKRASMRYQGTFDVFGLIEAAKKELAQPAPEQFKVFLLAVMAGLRRREIDTLEWSAFRWERGSVRIEPTKWFHPKSEDSIGNVEIDPELLEVFREYQAKGKGCFVIESKVKPRLDLKWEHYRCTSIFENRNFLAPNQGSDFEGAAAYVEKRIWESDCGGTRDICRVSLASSCRHHYYSAALSR